MIGGLLGGNDPSPDIIVERSRDGWWSARGSMAHDLDGARTLERVLEVIAVRHPADVLVEVRGDGDPWRATGAELASTYTTNYRTPSPRTADGGDDPFFDFN